MSAYQAPRGSRVPTLSESGYRGKLHLKLNDRFAPVTFVWWAATPKGRDSIHTQDFTFERLRCASQPCIGEGGKSHPVYVPTAYWWKTIQELHAIAKSRSHAILKHLPPGYVWYGPYLHSVINPSVAIADGDAATKDSACLFELVAPLPADMSERKAKIELATQLARRALQSLSARQAATA